jgi:copper chaperone CopZ
MSERYSAFALLGLLIISGCVGTATGEVEMPSATAGEVHRAVLSIDGMTCPGCAYAAEQALLKTDGVIEAEVSYQEKRGIVTYDSGKVSVKELGEAVRPFVATLVGDNEVEVER